MHSNVLPLKMTRPSTWINIDGISDTDILKELGKCFGFHPLILEDILNTEQRPDPEQNL